MYLISGYSHGLTRAEEGPSDYHPAVTEDDPAEQLSQRARVLRERQFLTHQQVGDRLGLTGSAARQRSYKLENGYHRGTPASLATYAEVGLGLHRANLWLEPEAPLLEDLARALLELRSTAPEETDRVLQSRGIKVGWLREVARDR
jgi:transcriptional regulator with XRE-family HTH domain